MTATLLDPRLSALDELRWQVGNTPLHRIVHLNPKPGVEVYAKLEWQQFGGSVKARLPTTSFGMPWPRRPQGSPVVGRVVRQHRHRLRHLRRGGRHSGHVVRPGKCLKSASKSFAPWVWSSC